MLDIKNKLSNFGFIKKSQYGKIWNEKSGDEQNEWYSKMHDSCKAQHDMFTSFLHEKKDIVTVLEVGCGTGIYPIKHNELFFNKKIYGNRYFKNSY